MDVETHEHVQHLNFLFWTGCRWIESSCPAGRRCQLKECQQALEDGEQGGGSARQADRRLPWHQRWDTGGDRHAGGAAEEESRTSDQSREERGNTVGTQKEKVSSIVGHNERVCVSKNLLNIFYFIDLFFPSYFKYFLHQIVKYYYDLFIKYNKMIYNYEFKNNLTHKSFFSVLLKF